MSRAPDPPQELSERYARRIRALAHRAWIAGLLLLASPAAAQGARHHAPEAGIAFPVAAGWTLAAAEGADGEIVFEMSGDGGATLVVVRTPVPAVAMDALRSLGPAAVTEAWSAFAEEVAGARVVGLGQRTVAGRVAGRVDYAGDAVGGALLTLVGDDAVFTIVSMAPGHRQADAEAALEALLAGFELLAVGAAATAPANPLAAAPANPLASGPANPLASGPANPLAATPVNPLAGPTPPPAEPVVGGHESTIPARHRYHESFTGTDPATVFGGVLDVGTSGAWTATLDGRGYHLRNDQDGSAVRYYYAVTLPGVPGPLSGATTGIEVDLRPAGGFAAAGLVFDYDPASGAYLAFAITDEGYAVLQNTGTGLRLLAQEPSDTVVAGAPNRVELRPEPGRVTMLVNGRTAVSLESDTPFAGGIGIVAIGAGSFAFRDLEVAAP